MGFKILLSILLDAFLLYNKLIQEFTINFLNLLEKSAKSIYNITIEERRNIGGKKMATKEKNFWILLVFILSGLVIGGLLGKLAGSISWLWWLSYEQGFGLESPIILDLNVLKITFGFAIKINIASIIGMVLAIFIYKKI